MRNRKKPIKYRRSMATVIVTGSIVSVSTSMLLVAAVSALMLGGAVDIGHIKIAVYVILFLSVLAGTTITARNVESHIAIAIAAVTAVYLFTLITINIIFYNGTFDHWWVSFLLAVVPAVLSVLLSVHGSKGKRRYTRA